MKPISPIISVIIATHNRTEYLPTAVKSILEQTYQDFEIIIVDDASQDQTPDVIQELQIKDRRIRSIRSEVNIGPGAARNLGVQQAQRVISSPLWMMMIPQTLDV